MHHEVWSTNTGNLVADCDTEADALTLVRGLLAAGWSADDLAVALEYDEGEQIDDSLLPPPLCGAALALRAETSFLPQARRSA